MSDKERLRGGCEAEIQGQGEELVISRHNKELFRLKAPSHAGFYTFAEHYAHGVCPIVSFDPEHAINDWMDWYYRVDIDGQSMERLSPWK